VVVADLHHLSSSNHELSFLAFGGVGGWGGGGGSKKAVVFAVLYTVPREIPSVCCCRVLSIVEVVRVRTLLGIDQNGGRL
jgi:hypothetical protein